MSKTVEEAFDKRARVWVMANSLDRGTTWDQARIDAFAAGAAHGAAEERQRVLTILAEHHANSEQLRDLTVLKSIMRRIRQRGEK